MSIYGDPRGEEGQEVLEIMNKGHEGLHRFCLAKAGLSDGMTVLDIVSGIK